MQPRTATSALIVATTLVFVLLLSGCNSRHASSPPAQPTATPVPSPQTNQSYYLGFDRNQYPGDDVLPRLRETFEFTGYWLNNPPGESSNSWLGKRPLLKEQGFGFAVLFNARLSQNLHGPNHASLYGIRDGKKAVESARREGFPTGTVIFLDQEEGGRLLREHRAYLHAWVDTVNLSGYRAGLYCSGIGFKEPDSGETVITAHDVRNNAGGRRIVFWVYNDQCMPSPGCVFPKDPPAPSGSGTSFADVWQFAQSPQSPQAADCRKSYDKDGNCYAPGTSLNVDVSTALSSDPSRGR